MGILGKIALCSSLRSTICDEQGVGSHPLWTRYSQLETIVKNKLPDQYQDFFAQPQKILNGTEEEICWFAKPSVRGDHPIQLSCLEGDEKQRYAAIKDQTIEAYRQAAAECRNQGDNTSAEFLEKALKHVGEHDEFFFCYDDKVVATVWSMRPRNITNPAQAIVYRDIAPAMSYTVTFDLNGRGTSAGPLTLRKRSIDAPIREDQVPAVAGKSGWTFIGWDKQPVGHKVTENTVFTAQYEEEVVEKPVYDVRFVDNVGLVVKELHIPEGECIPAQEIPSLGNLADRNFIGWEDAAYQPVHSHLTLRPVYSDIVPSAPAAPIMHTVRFLDADGRLVSECQVPEGQCVPESAIPTLGTHADRPFVGWGDAIRQPIYHDTSMAPVYGAAAVGGAVAALPWWKRFGLWWRERGCFRSLLRFLIGLLLLLLLLFLLSKCRSCTPPIPLPWDRGDSTEVPVDSTGNYADTARYLPPENQKPLPVDDGDIITDPDGNRQIVGNRLNVLIDCDDISIQDFAYDFKQAYPGEQYKIIYADENVKRLQLQVPSNERVQIKQELVDKLPEKYRGGEKIFIWDDALLQSQAVSNDPRIGECTYHDAIHTYGAWDYCMGSEDIIVAVVDDGFNLRHEEFKDKVVSPYNVYTHTDDVKESSVKHGTHVAGLAIAAANNGKGIAGVAPNCKLMPIKVFDDNGYCTMNPIIDGVLYAMYHGAHVVNLSLGTAFTEGIPVDMQQEIIRNCFKEEERVWKKVFSMANRNNTTIVIAAGNENVLAGMEPMHRSDDAIVVAAVDPEAVSNGRARFSNYGAYTDVSAPGVGMLSTVGGSKYEKMSGTSMASPVVAGAVALIKSVNRPLTTSQIRTILKETGLHVDGNIGPLIQLDKALARAKNEEVAAVDRPQPSTGSVQVLLEWNDYNDLDLKCKDPRGDMVWYQNKHVASGGMLEIDMNAGGQYSLNPLENIYWPQDGAPTGKYEVWVNYYERHDTNHSSSDFKVTVIYGSNRRTYTGTVTSKGQTVRICDFTLE